MLPDIINLSYPLLKVSFVFPFLLGNGPKNCGEVGVEVQKESREWGRFLAWSQSCGLGFVCSADYGDGGFLVGVCGLHLVDCLGLEVSF